ncbi:MAG: hypothetical protein QM754_10155 [Tepidisphaeraceae bacterium]
MNALKIASAVTVSAVVAGCTVGPDYKRPEVAVPETFAATQPASTQPATQPAPVDLTRWWESFNDAKLTALINDAVVNNFDVRIAQARVRQAACATRRRVRRPVPDGRRHRCLHPLACQQKHRHL